MLSDEASHLSSVIDSGDCYSGILWESSIVLANPDIAEIGVIVAFVSSAGIAILSCILYGILDGLKEPECSLAKSTRKLLLKRGWLSKDGAKLTRFMERLSKWIIALSDQQLITGLAVLIATFVQWRTIQVYHFEIATSLGFCASMTHLATLFTIGKYVRKAEGRQIAYVTLGGMIVMLALLFVGNIYSGYHYWDPQNNWPMRCIAKDIKKEGRKAYGGPPTKLTIAWAVLLIFDYTVAVGSLFDRSYDWAKSWIVTGADSNLDKIRSLKPDPGLFNIFMYYCQLQYFHIKWLWFVLLKHFNAWPWFMVKILGWYLYTITTMFIWRRYGQRWLDDNDSENNVQGFGQIVPLVMLASLFLSALEGRIFD